VSTTKEREILKRPKVHRRDAGREKKSKFGGLSHSCRPAVFSVVKNHRTRLLCCFGCSGRLISRAKLADFVFYTAFSPRFVYATAAGCRQRRRIHTQML
jgi:hypothetical protein